MRDNTKFSINNIEREKEILDVVRKNIDFLNENKIIFTQTQNSLEKEYKVKKYKDYKKWIKEEWKKREGGFLEKLLIFFNKPAKTQFIIEISNYGPLGFYNVRTNTVTINMNTMLDAVKTIKHEMIHIILEPFIKKYSIEHKQKEDIVNTVLDILENIN